MTQQILIGADPEVFVKNPNSGAFVSAHGMIRGDKQHPYPVRNGAVQVDGMALEFNITPAATREQFITNVKDVYQQLKNMVPGYNLTPEPCAIFEQGYFDGCAAESKVLGCDPDYNAWTGLANDPPQPDQPMRTAAGHIHVGWTDGRDPFGTDHYEDCRMVARQLDYFVGIQSLIWDQDNRRRSMYGKAGAFRPKPYGMEYRVPSNVWLKNDNLMAFVYDNTHRAIELLFDGKDYGALYGSRAREIIDNNITNWFETDQFEDIQPFKAA